MRSIFIFKFFVASLICAQLSYGAGQEPAGSSVVTYEKDYFVNFDVVTLLDMLNRIPGFQEILEKSRREREQQSVLGTAAPRGFGSGGDQILINGKRMAGKDNNIDDTLARVSATVVQRVELIRGAASGLDVQSQGLVINVILDQGIATSTTFWKLGGRFNLGDSAGHILTLSHSGSVGNLDYSATLDSNRNFRLRFRDDDISYGGSDVIARNMIARSPYRKDNHKISANVAYNFEDGAVLRLNALYNPETQHDIETRTFTFLDENFGPAITVVDDTLNEDGSRKLSDTRFNDVTPTKWELGGDYTRSLGIFGSLKSLFVFNKENSDIGKVFSRGEGSSEFIYQSQSSKLDKSESILRSSVSKGIAQGQSLEVGGELALNKFNRNFQNNTRSALGGPLLLRNDDDVKIKENRYELFVNHSYTISQQISLQSSVTTEFSKIVADNIFSNGDIDRRTAKFTFVKPRINFRYDLTNLDQIRLTAERTVSQLDFNNFATSFNTLTEKIDFGNTAIRPERSWDFTAAFEHRLPNDNGSVSLEVFYKKITDHIDKVDFTEYVDNLGNPISADAYFALTPDLQTLVSSDFISKFGNIDNAKSIGFKFKSNYRLGSIGLKEAVLSFNYEYTKSTFLDTFTKDVIPFSFRASKDIYIGYRHDVSSLNLSYGGSVNFRRGFVANDIRLIWAGTPGTLIDVFVERNILVGIKLRISAKELSKEASDSIQLFYNKHSRFDDLNNRVHRVSFTARVIEATLQGTF